MTEDQLLTVREVARRCHRSEETIRRWIWSGKLKARKLGNQLYINPAALDGMAVAELREISTDEGERAPLQDLYRRYDYSPLLEDLREFRGQILPSKEDELRHIKEDQALQHEMLAKYGPVDAVDLVREVREE